MLPMAPRPEDDALSESELAELKRNLLLLSGSSVGNFYRDAHKECSLERKPNAKAIQQLVTAWKVLRGWGWK
jgi:hypothetical protein